MLPLRMNCEARAIPRCPVAVRAIDIRLCARRRPDYAGVLKAEFLSYTVLSNESVEFSTTIIYPWLNRSVCFSVGSSA